ncbi:hypothetical protein ACHAXR_010875 [Thalassiosira sp. AJA248-18]
MRATRATDGNRSAHPPFPEPGSVIGPDGRYFCIGRLGKGTFCAIHKCVDLSYSHTLMADGDADDDAGKKHANKRQRIVAAKVELANFVDSGVIDGEASVLKFLDASLPTGMVPTFVDYVRQPPAPPNIAAPAGAATTTTEKGTADGGLSAIIMECLPGEDMHLLRDRHCQAIAEKGDAGGNNAPPSREKAPRRLSVEDAVYLVADVMLPLLKAMHEVGMVHRDVKPSNVVRTGTTPSDRKFKIVDFGLSKSFVVPKDSSFADPKRPWGGRWMSPSYSKAGEAIKDDNMEACVRIEREAAEFRGTSMYASLRVHQGKDHCPRDDIWGLMYVFCDLVSGGLPWMEYASARDRSSCQILKEMVVGERGRDDWSGNNEEEGKKEGMAGKPNPDKVPKNGEDAIEWLLFGHEHHIVKYKRDMKSQQQGSSSDPDTLPSLPEPLAISKNDHCVNCLRKAFRHLATLGFVEMPDYDLIGQCLRGFLHDINPKHSVPSIDWKDRPSSSKRRRSTTTINTSTLDTGGVAWNLLDEEDVDPLDDHTLVEAENDRRAALEAAAAVLDDASRSAKGGDGNTNTPAASALDPGASFTGEAADITRLPLQVQFSLSQAEYNARHARKDPLHLALRDWMALAVPLAHGMWDTPSWERGNHRTDDDGYRNEVYMSMLQKCLDAADPFNRFSDRECYYYPLVEGETKRKRRRVGTSAVPQLVSDNSVDGANDSVSESPLVVVSRVFFSLRLALDMQRGKNFAPPPKLSFGFGRA